MNKPRISDQEFKDRVANVQKAMRDENLDMLLCFGNEAEPQFVRYFSDYWPSFESAGVFVPAEGYPLLVIGPESETFSRSVSRIPDIRKVLAFRESSEPEYPGAKLSTFADVIREASAGKPLRSFGLAGYSLMPKVIFDEVEKALAKFGGPEVQRQDLLVARQRVIKTPAEIACLREAYRIAQKAMRCVVENIRPGMTENQVKGIAVAAIFEEGGEGEAYPFWILSGLDTNLAIGRCRNKVLRPGDMVQVQVGARHEGYVASMGRPVVLGKADDFQRGMIEAALAAQKAILETAKAGVNARAVSDAHLAALDKLGYKDHVLYGPCHGTGLVEGEYPWIETSSNFPLEADMTFCTCVYLGDDRSRIGLRVEDGYRVTVDGAESFSDYRREVIEVC